jgi:hypothetical protein
MKIRLFCLLLISFGGLQLLRKAASGCSAFGLRCREPVWFQWQLMWRSPRTFEIYRQDCSEKLCAKLF